MHGSRATITNCTFSGNSGGGLYDYDSRLVVVNSVFWGNKRGNEVSGIEFGYVMADNRSRIVITYSDVEGGCTVASGCTVDETGNLDTDPLFVDAANGNLKLQPLSPCIDTAASASASTQDVLGNSRTDIAGVANEVPNAADMGAYEFQP
jgi:hypothetical protein